MTTPVGQTPAYSPGLEGVIAGETAISTVEDGLRYRGYPVGELCERRRFEEVAYLLLYGELPSAKELQAFETRVGMARRLPDCLHDLFRSLPSWATPLDVLRTGVSVLAHFDPDTADNSPAANLRKAERLLGQIPIIVADHYRIANHLPLIPASDTADCATNFLTMVHGSAPTPEDVKAFDVSLILYAEHEFNASTFACRTIVSTMSDLHAAVVGGLGAWKGPLHGGANEKIIDILEPIGDASKAEAWVMDALARKERIMGFGHRVYKSGDVRAGILKAYAAEAAKRAGTTKYEEIAEVVETVMAREKKMYPNLDWPAGRLYHALNLKIPLYTPIFAMSRITGWSAHIMEQLANNRLIRPRGLYNGVGPRSVPDAEPNPGP